MRSDAAIGKAINLAGAETIVDSLLMVRTKLDTSGFDSTPLLHFQYTGSSKTSLYTTSGGEVMSRSTSCHECRPTDLLLMIVARIAISVAFMREINRDDLLLFDEPVRINQYLSWHRT